MFHGAGPRAGLRQCMKLMIVDDHEGVRGLIRQMVEGPGDTLVECDSADAAVAMAAGFRPECITLDVRMPGMSCWEALRTLRREHAGVRVAVVTSHDEPLLRQAAAEAGADAFFVKSDLSGLRQALLGIRCQASPGERVGTALEPEGPALATTAGEADVLAAMLVQELAAPFRSIDGAITRLRSSPVLPGSEGQARVLDQLSDGCRAIGSLLQRLEPLRLLAMPELRTEWVVSMASVHAAWQPLAPAAQARIRVRALPRIRTHRGLLDVVFRELLSNAARFASDVAVSTIEVDCVPDGAEAVFSVRDNGVGFRMDQVHRLFQPFGKLHDDGDHPGLGIGLFIVRRVVSRLGGRVWATGRPGQGACFSFSLPLSRERSVL